VRVSQAWAGSGWGAMHLPHVGHEVIVSFIEGDPDQPIITGRVYNDKNKPADSLPGEQHKSVIRSFGDNDIVVEDKEGDKHILLKQACGNEIRMHEKTPDIEIKQECGNEILMKASGADIEIKQACGNEILMHEAEGIQIRDKFGNEIVLDSVAGTMKLRSPSHESVIELGKSVWIGTMSDFKQNAKGNLAIAIYGTKDEYIVGPVKIKYDGINISNHGGLVQDNFIGGKSSNFVGVNTSFSASYSTSHTVGWKRTKDDSSVLEEVDGRKKEIMNADYSQIVTGKFIMTSGEQLSLGEGGSEFTMKGGDIEIRAAGDITIRADGNINLKPGGKVVIPKGKLDAKDLGIN
ncbi:MAG: phage baseplate assembly protein V, partial [Desulfobacterales bacterium]|nr:phage baseplate assembly protein V [Desulfobacterales bacterium]